MPHISITLYPGRGMGELEKLSSDVQMYLVKTAGWKPSDISVSVEEIESEKFALQVNKKIENEELIIPSDFIK